MAEPQLLPNVCQMPAAHVGLLVVRWWLGCPVLESLSAPLFAVLCIRVPGLRTLAGRSVSMFKRTHSTNDQSQWRNW